jgi:hypothetical protein
MAINTGGGVSYSIRTGAHDQPGEGQGVFRILPDGRGVLEQRGEQEGMGASARMVERAGLTECQKKETIINMLRAVKGLERNLQDLLKNSLTEQAGNDTLSSKGGQDSVKAAL